MTPKTALTQKNREVVTQLSTSLDTHLPSEQGNSGFFTDANGRALRARVTNHTVRQGAVGG